MTKRWTPEMLDKLGNDKGFLPAAYWPMQLVIIESPYAGEVEANVEYARAAMRDSLNRGEAPIASHLLYTQPGILRDEHPEERQWGIDAGLAWRRVADRAVFYVDRNWSGGMLAARKVYREEGFPYEVRTLAGEVVERFPCDSDGTPTGAINEDLSEEWRAVPGYEGYYEVSNLGSVRSLARVVPSTAHGLRRTIHPRVLKQRPDRDGYPIVTLTRDSVAKLVPVHRLVAMAFHGPCPEGRECAHLDGNRANPRFDNLTWASKAENEAHKYLHGTRQARAESIAQNTPKDKLK